MRKFLYEINNEHMECINEMHYEIRFPEVISHDEAICKDLLEEFERQMRTLAWKMGIKLEEM